jgi:Family of unknown function (DUF6288)/Beta-galactosidase jelly roll domain
MSTLHTKLRLFAVSAMLLAFPIVAPLKLSAQEMDFTAERAGGGGGDDDEPEKGEEYGDEDLLKPADTWPKGDYAVINGRDTATGMHLGPTGLWGIPAGQNIWVKVIEPNSPAAGKILPEDVIYGANGKGFPAARDVRYSFAMAITEAETKELGGTMTLHVRRENKLIQVPIQLKVMGSYSSTTPFNCEKSKNIIAGAEEYMRKGLRPEKGLPYDGGYMFGPWNDSVLFLLASGNPEMQGLVRRYIRKTTKDLDAWKSWNQERGLELTYNGWGIAYFKMLYAEYYHRTGDPTVLPYLEDNYFNRGPNPNKAQPGGEVKPQTEDRWSWPPIQPTGYGTHPNGQMVGTMGNILASEAGLNINKAKIVYDLKYLYIKRAEYGHVAYNGYGAQPIERRQVEEPLEITPENKADGSYSSMNGKLGAAAALFSMVTGYEKAVDMCSIRCVYAFNHTNRGHGGIWFNGFWTPIGAYHAGPEKFTEFMKKQQWWRELYRDHTGAMWETGNAKEKKDTLSTGFAIHWAMPRKKLRMFGAPRSMFCTDAPAYMKEALAAHRNRDYASAEQLTLKLQASGTVPPADKARVDHFLDSVKTLKASVEHDLAFTEGLLKKGNYALAGVELPQLEMVVSPGDPRLKAIAKALESTQAKAHIAAAIEQKEQAQKAHLGNKGAAKAEVKDDFQEELASLFPLVKDGQGYEAPKGARTRTKGDGYPFYSKKELPPWRRLQMECWTNAPQMQGLTNVPQMRSLADAPQGWEQPNFDDSKWKTVTLPSTWPRFSSVLLRTTFNVEDVNAFTSLRVRGTANRMSNMTLYLNGEIVAKVIPSLWMQFDLRPEALKVLKKGKNTLALYIHRDKETRNFSLRLEGILKNPSKSGMDPFEQEKNLPDKKNHKKQDLPPEPAKVMPDKKNQKKQDIPPEPAKVMPDKKNQKKQDIPPEPAKVLPDKKGQKKQDIPKKK